MKFASLYSNEEEVFPTIYFKPGFNVVFAQVKDPAAKEQDSHNLGKTFLIKVLDFVLLDTINKEHPFRVHSDIFGHFTFYLEIETVNNQFVTIKRSVKQGEKISINVSEQRNLDLRSVSDTAWTFTGLSMQKASNELNSLLDVEAISPFPYRKGLGYFLRGQSDYDEVFRISKFQYGADRHWKPFVAKILGLDQNVIEEKYELDETIKKLENNLEIIEEEAGSTSDGYDEIRGLIEIRQARIDQMRKELDAFSFQEIEAQLSETNVSVIESEIATLNERRYTIDYELQEIEKSLIFEPEIDLEKVVNVFEEARILLPDSLVHSYEELIDFNRRISTGRTERLQNLRRKLQLERGEIETRLVNLDIRRQNAFRILQAQETIKKFKELQKILVDNEREVAELRQQLSQLDRASNTQREIEVEKQKLTEMVAKVRKVVRDENKLYSDIRRTFSDLVEQVLKTQALLSINVNQYGNLDFNVRTLDREITERETSEDQGTSYRKILAACFDLTLLIVHASEKFYRFVYHDGIFEGLDNRRKESLLNMVRNICNTYGIQYILTVIDSDLPRDERDEKLLFTKDEIIRELHDRGDQGRLFRTRAF